MRRSAEIAPIELTRRRALCGAVSVLSLCVTPLRFAIASEAAQAFIEKLAEDVLEIVVSTEPPAEKRARFHALLNDRADIEAIATFSLGKYARRISDEQKAIYYELVAAFISNVFVTYTADMGGEQVTVTGSTARSDTETLVSSDVLFPNGRSLEVDWRVVRKGGVFRVRDVAVNGIWLAIQQRSQFTSVITKGGGSIDALLNHLRENS